MTPRLIEMYRVGGGYKTLGAHETRWQFGNHEIRARVRRGNWQFHVSAGARVQGLYDPGLAHFPEWLEVRCPTMSESDLGAVELWAAQEWNGPIIVTTQPFMPVTNKELEDAA